MTDDARLQHWHASQHDAGARRPSSDHVDMDTLTRHAEGRLSPAMARLVAEHLLACEDGRCGEFVRSLGVGEPLHESPEPAGERSRPRTFQSREIAWATIDSLARELGVPIDDLMNEAMADYARVRGYPVPESVPRSDEAAHGLAAELQEERDPLEETRDAPAVSPLERSHSPPSEGFDDDELARTAARDAFVRPAARARTSSSDAPESRTTPQRRAVPLPAALNRPVPLPPIGSALASPPARSSRPVPPPPRSSGPGLPPPLPGRLTVPPAQRLPGARESSASTAKRLVLAYQGRQYPVEKDRFLLGRSKTQSDMRLEDPNVSRQHAAIERVGAAWYVVDLGSTNGVHVAGERVTRRALSDGDVIVITSHEIRCSLR